MSVSLSTITDTMLNILREEGFSTAYPQTLMELFANSAQQDILAGRVIHPFTKEEAQAGTLHFLNVDKYRDNVKPTTISTAPAVGDVVLYADTTGFPATGSIFFGGQTADYTSLTSTYFTLSASTPVVYPYLAGTMVSIAFPIPADFGSTLGVTYDNKFALPPRAYNTMFNDLNVFKGSNAQRNNLTSYYEDMYNVAPFYVIKDTAYLIVYQLNESGKSIHFRYMKIPPTMTSTGTPVNSIIDNDTYAQLCISELAVANMLFHRGEEQRAGEIFNLAISDVRKLYSWYDDIEFESQSGKAYTIGHGKRNI